MTEVLDQKQMEILREYMLDARLYARSARETVERIDRALARRNLRTAAYRKRLQFVDNILSDSIDEIHCAIVGLDNGSR